MDRFNEIGVIVVAGLMVTLATVMVISTAITLTTVDSNPKSTCVLKDEVNQVELCTAK